MSMNSIQASRAQSCVVLSPGNYSIQSVALPGELVGVGQPNANGFTLVLEKAPPQGNLGVVGVPTLTVLSSYTENKHT